MDTNILLRQLLRSPHASRTLLVSSTRPQFRTYALLSPQLPYARHLSLPTILRPSFLKEMVPKPFRDRQPSRTDKPKKEWNPATPFIILALLVGSQAIQILWLKQERDLETRRTEAKISVLQKVVERVQRGENVDVEALLGTGIEGREREWAGLIEEIEEEELLFQTTQEKKRIKAARTEEAKNLEKHNEENGQNTQDEAKVKVEELGGAKFY